MARSKTAILRMGGLRDAEAGPTLKQRRGIM